MLRTDVKPQRMYYALWPEDGRNLDLAVFRPSVKITLSPHPPTIMWEMVHVAL